MGEEERQLLLKLFKALADESRLKLLGLLATQEYSVGELAIHLNLREPTISHHLNKLQELDLGQRRREGTSHYYQLKTDTLKELHQMFDSRERVAALIDDPDSAAWERKVFKTFFEGERLTQIPHSHKKKLVILKWLAQQFEAERRYSEREVTEIISRYHPDYATLRRGMIDAHLMQRANGIYWRSSEVDDSSI